MPFLMSPTTLDCQSSMKRPLPLEFATWSPPKHIRFTTPSPDFVQKPLQNVHDEQVLSSSNRYKPTPGDTPCPKTSETYTRTSDSLCTAQQFLQKLLQNPLEFLTASDLTLHDEMVILRNRKAVNSISAEHSGRRRAVLALENHESHVHRKYRKKPLGFRNPGQLCYRRSVLQAMFNSEYFWHYLQRLTPCSHSGQTTIGNQAPISARCVGCTLREISTIIDANNPLHPTLDLQRAALRAAVGRFDQAARRMREQPDWASTENVQFDANDFYCSIVIHLNTYFSPLIPIGPGQAIIAVVEGIFETHVRSSYTCKHCQMTTVQPVEAMKSIPVRLGLAFQRKCPTQNSLALIDCLPDSFEEAIEPVCPGCKRTSNTSTIRKIISAPETLVFQIARFRFTAAGNARKDMTTFRIPHNLDLGEYVDRNHVRESDVLNYRLNAVVQHGGSLKGGHYITRLTNPTGTWEMNDDRIAKELKHKDLISDTTGFTSYLLFYNSLDMRSSPFARM